MSLTLLQAMVRENWYLAVLLALVLLAAVGAYVRSADSQGEAAAAAGSGEETAAAVPADAASPDRPTERATAEQTIAEHRAFVDRNPQAPEAPARLAAMGNLYTQRLGDYKNAVQCYELLLHDYPDSTTARNAYIQLLTCYEQLEDRANYRRICETMMRRFPEDSQEHQYAKLQLAR